MRHSPISESIDSAVEVPRRPVSAPTSELSAAVVVLAESVELGAVPVAAAALAGSVAIVLVVVAAAGRSAEPVPAPLGPGHRMSVRWCPRYWRRDLHSGSGHLGYQDPEE